MRGATLFLLALAGAAPAGEPALRFPLDCTLGTTCFVQNHVDAEPGSGAHDFACGTLTYDGHKGTDIRVPSLHAMRAGVDVLAAASGRVTATRDGMPDIAFNDPAAEPVGNRECGNGIVVALDDDGWETQYCHLQRGSIAVREGDRVASGSPIARVGLSGMTEFPHLHVELRRAGGIVDPFAPAVATTCGRQSAQLWSPPLEYMPGGIVNAGISLALPDYDAVREGAPSPTATTTDAPAIVLWGLAYGLAANDLLTLRLVDPMGRTVAEDRYAVDRSRAEQYRAAGRKRPGGGWPTGIYKGEVTLVRDGTAIAERVLSVEVRQMP